MNRGPFGSTVCAWDIQSRADRFEVSDELKSCAATFGAVQELQLVCHGGFFTFVAGDDRTAEPIQSLGMSRLTSCPQQRSIASG